ncbi:DNA methyltransferase [Chloroflexota bacterium]
MTGAGSVTISTTSIHEGRPGLTPRLALQSIRVNPIPFVAAKRILVNYHYLHSLPGGTKLAFGAFVEGKLLGAITFGSGPQNAYQLVAGATPEDCLTLSRLWLSDELPRNSESRIIGVALRAISKHTGVKFLVSYADPSIGHLGIIYQATGWTYTGLSEAMPKFDLGDGKARHSRSLGQAFGSHSVKYFKTHGIKVKVIPQPRKHRYLYFLDSSYRIRLKTNVYPYPRKEAR